MKLPENPFLPLLGSADYDRRLGLRLFELFASIARKVNGIASGSVSALDGGSTAAPTTGAWAVGDFVRNTAPVELGGAGSRYVVTGWLCITAGEPGAWVPLRAATGN